MPLDKTEICKCLDRLTNVIFFQSSETSMPSFNLKIESVDTTELSESDIAAFGLPDQGVFSNVDGSVRFTTDDKVYLCRVTPQSITMLSNLSVIKTCKIQRNAFYDADANRCFQFLINGNISLDVVSVQNLEIKNESPEGRWVVKSSDLPKDYKVTFDQLEITPDGKFVMKMYGTSVTMARNGGGSNQLYFTAIPSVSQQVFYMFRVDLQHGMTCKVEHTFINKERMTMRFAVSIRGQSEQFISSYTLQRMMIPFSDFQGRWIVMKQTNSSFFNFDVLIVNECTLTFKGKTSEVGVDNTVVMTRLLGDERSGLMINSLGARQQIITEHGIPVDEKHSLRQDDTLFLEIIMPKVRSTFILKKE